MPQDEPVAEFHEIQRQLRENLANRRVADAALDEALQEITTISNDDLLAVSRAQPTYALELRKGLVCLREGQKVLWELVEALESVHDMNRETIESLLRTVEAQAQTIEKMQE